MKNLRSKRIKAVIFDLDDTLYNQMQHLAGAYLSVGRLMNRLFGLNPLEVKRNLLKLAKVKGSASGMLFNILLENYKIKPENELLNRMISTFYSYKLTKLEPYKDAANLLRMLKKKGLKLGLLTEGRPELQKAKLEALGFKKLFDDVIVTDELGGRYKKPNPEGFSEIAKRLGVKPEESIYLGDNPKKDFIGPRKIGMLTVRVLTGEYRKTKVESDLESDITIRSLNKFWKALKDYL